MAKPATLDLGFDLARAYGGRRVLVTGATGFKGAWLAAWLTRLGAEVHGLSLPPVSQPNLFDALRLEERIASRLVDIRDAGAVRATVAEIAPDIVLHLAAQALVRPSYADPLGTFATNVMGTAHVLDACRFADSVKAVVCVTTDKVYANREWPWPYRETDRLGGIDPYSASKACAELVAHVYQRNLATDAYRMATARGGNVVGGGDWSADRIVPDIVRALSAGTPIVLRNPAAIRPWQHVLELCEGYLELGARLLAGEDSVAACWNFGPRAANEVSVGTLVTAMLDIWERPNWAVSVSASPLHEAQLLRLDISRALASLAWQPRLDIAETLRWTAQWYKDHHDAPERAWETTMAQIDAFQGLRQGLRQELREALR